MLSKNQILERLEQMAFLMDIAGENPFKIKAYKNAIDAIEQSSENLAELSAEQRLTEIKGIGKGIAAFITECLETGTSQELETIKLNYPIYGSYISSNQSDFFIKQ